MNWQKIWNIEQHKTSKVITLLGFKIKFRYHNNYDKETYRQMQRLNCAVNLHQKTFAKYKNINNGKTVVLVATGPSLKNFKPIKNAIYVGVNRAFTYDKIQFDYLFLQDFAGQTPHYIKEFLAYGTEKTQKFLGIVDDEYYPKSVIPDIYRQGKNINNYYSAPWNIQNWFAYDLTCQMFGDCYSIVFPAMQFILWTHPKRIYLVGCDCNQKGYYNSNDKNKLAADKVLQGWQKLKEFIVIYYPDIEIISINPFGLKGMFKDLSQTGSKKWMR